MWRYAGAWRIAEHPLLARRKRAPQVLGIDGGAAALELELRNSLLRKSE
jgi:hypothetical protein